MDRYRYTDTRLKSFYEYDDYNPDGTHTGYFKVPINNGTYRSGRLKEIWDVPQKGYYTAKANGEVILHPATISDKVYVSSNSDWTIGNHPVWGRRHQYGDMAANNFLRPSGGSWTRYQDSVLNAKALALIEAYAKMNSPDVLLSVAYKERGKTAAMIRRPLEGASSQLERIFARKTKLLKRGLSVAQATAQAWLELRFGWRPLMYDIAGIAQAALHEKPINGRLLVSRGGADVSYLESVRDTTLSVKKTHNWSQQDRASAGVLYSYRDLTEAEWRAKCLGLNLRTVPAHIWEVIPFSFVADYFVKVGLWLDAITPDPDVVVRGNWVSLRTDYVYETTGLVQDVLITNPPATNYSMSGGSYSETGKILARTVNQSVSATPPLAAKPLSFSQTVDIAALLFGKVRGGLSRLRF